MSATVETSAEIHVGPGVQVPPVDPEPLSEADMEGVRFGRSRLLKQLAGATFGYAIASAIEASPVLACTKRRASTLLRTVA